MIYREHVRHNIKDRRLGLRIRWLGKNMHNIMIEYVFPNCGITMDDVLSVAKVAPNKRAAAKRLGVSERQFYQVVKDRGLSGLFQSKKPRPRCVTREDIIYVANEGYTRDDAAHILGISPYYLKDLLQVYQITEFSMNRSDRIKAGKFGYCR